MGLDMYLIGRKFLFDREKQPTEDGFPVRQRELDLGYWRKHPDLHGYIVQTFANGVDECQEIELDADALRQILVAIGQKKLPHTEGFFFGASENDAKQRRRDVEILGKALEWLEGVKPMPEPERIGVGSAMVAIKIEPSTIPDEIRSVVYRASW